MRAISLSAVGVVLAATACQPASHPDRLANTLFNNVCHFNFDCCTPSERVMFSSLGGGAVNKAACIEELHDTFGGAFEVASAAVEAGTAVYDAEEAERCSIQAAIDSCDAQTVLGVGQSQGFTQLLYGIDATDDDCLLLASRAFTRGTVKDGGACTSFIDCADEGTCTIDEGESKGTCVAPAKEGDDCSERSCAPGLNCDDTTARCVAEVLFDDGASCEFDEECTSGACVGLGTCSSSGEACASSLDCGFNAICDGGLCDDGVTTCSFDEDCPVESCEDGPVCGEAEKITVEVCNGL
jgi:hypothetical protein